MDYFKESLKLHKEAGGKVEVVSKVKLQDQQDLSSQDTVHDVPP